MRKASGTVRSSWASTFALAPNTTVENKQGNRRVEFDIEEMEGKRYEVATDPCAPNTYRKGYVTLNAPGWSGSDVTFELDKPQYNYLETAKIRYSRPLDVPEGQQYWITINRAGDPDTNNGEPSSAQDGRVLAIFAGSTVDQSSRDTNRTRCSDPAASGSMVSMENPPRPMSRTRTGRSDSSKWPASFSDAAKRGYRRRSGNSDIGAEL